MFNRLNKFVIIIKIIHSSSNSLADSTNIRAYLHHIKVDLLKVVAYGVSVSTRSTGSAAAPWSRPA